MTITEIAEAVAENAAHNIVGIRPGEKLHEQMISAEDSLYTYEYDRHYKILPQIYGWSDDKQRIKNGKPVPEGFCYASDNNTEWMKVETLKKWLDENKGKLY